MILAGFYSGEIKHRCKKDDKVWGCNSPVKKPRWNLPCLNCLGEKGDSSCKTCGGFGAVGQYECPNRLNTLTMNQAVNAYADLKEYGILPVRGAMLDQSVIFNEVVAIFPTFVSAWHKFSAETKAEFERRSRGRSKA